MVTALQYQGDLIDSLMNILGDKFDRLVRFGFCGYEYGESSYGSGDGVLCGKDAVGSSIEHQEPRCRTHFGK